MEQYDHDCAVVRNRMDILARDNNTTWWEYITRVPTWDDELMYELNDTELDPAALVNTISNLSDEADAAQRHDLYDKAARKWGPESQIIVAIEELAELQQALTKYLRLEEHNVEEEVADVSIMLEQITSMFDEREIKRIKKEKIERLGLRLL